MADVAYVLRGARQGFDLRRLVRTDDDDGYSTFRRADGTVQAVVLTALLTSLCWADGG